MPEPIVWPGDQQEAGDLQQAAEHNCDCLYVDGIRTATCSAHRLFTDQRALNGLVVMRHLADRLKAEEQQGPEWPEGEHTHGD